MAQFSRGRSRRSSRNRPAMAMAAARSLWHPADLEMLPWPGLGLQTVFGHPHKLMVEAEGNLERLRQLQGGRSGVEGQ